MLKSIKLLSQTISNVPPTPEVNHRDKVVEFTNYGSYLKITLSIFPSSSHECTTMDVGKVG